MFGSKLCTLGAAQLRDRNMGKLVDEKVLTLKVLHTPRLRLQKYKGGIEKESFTPSLKSWF